MFLCLCAGALDLETSCKPISEQPADTCCEHEEPLPEIPQVHEDEDCNDILIVGSDIELADRGSENSILKAPIGTFAFQFEANSTLFTPNATLQARDARAPPETANAQTIYSRTIRLIL